MECQSSDSKKLFKVFDASKRKRTRKKREGIDDTNSLATDDSNSACQGNHHNLSDKASMEDLPTPTTINGHPNGDTAARGSNTSMHRDRGKHRSPHRHRRSTREGLSLALKAASTPRSISPPQDGDGCINSPTRDGDSIIYAFLEEAIKRDKKKHRHRHEESRSSRDREGSPRERHRHRRRKDDATSRERDKHRKEKSPTPAIDQTVLLETFAKLCAQMNEKSAKCTKEPEVVKSSHSRKSLQGEPYRRDSCSAKQRPEPNYHDTTPTRIRSHENCRENRSRDHETHRHENPDYYERPKYSKMDLKEPKYCSKFDVDLKEQRCCSKFDVNRRHQDDPRYPPEEVPTRTCLHRDYRDRPRESYREYDRRYEDERRRFCEQKTSRSFDEQRNYIDDRCRRTTRSDKDKFYEKQIEAQERHFANKERRCRRPLDKFDTNSVTSREEQYRDRDRLSERERDSGLSVADETSTVSGRSNYLRVVKQEIAEQREAMDKMMKLWKDLMRCFKGISQSQIKDKTINESACENVRESAVEQLRLWRECMRRYETVARDVGDTDARLMEEINKQRSEMGEMASMWQECLQRYRDMSNDFNTLKQKLVTSESPSRTGAPVCVEGEAPAPYRYPPTYPIPPTANPSVYPVGVPSPGAALQGRASAPPAPPAWWWGAPSPRPRSRRSSPDSRDRDTDRRDDSRRHRHKDTRDECRHKEKSGKPSAARSDHRRRKR